MRIWTVKVLKSRTLTMFYFKNAIYLKNISNFASDLE